MIKIFDSAITDIVPLTPANEAHVRSLSYAVGVQLKDIEMFVRSAQVMCMIDNASEQILDTLAVEFKTQYYDDNLEVERKRELVRKTFVWYMTAGTRESLAEAVTSVFSDARITEWKDTQNDPFTFEVETTAQIQEDQYKKFELLVDTMKNARSHFKSLKLKRNIGFQMYQGMAISEFITNRYTVPTSEPNFIVLTDEDNKALLDEMSRMIVEEIKNDTTTY